MIVNILMCIIESAHDFKNALNENTLNKSSIKKFWAFIRDSVLDKLL